MSLFVRQGTLRPGKSTLKSGKFCGNIPSDKTAFVYIGEYYLFGKYYAGLKKSMLVLLVALVTNKSYGGKKDVNLNISIRKTKFDMRKKSTNSKEKC